MFTRLILKWTHRLWNRQISRILCRAYSDGLINSYQMHELVAAFDPTQKHRIYGDHTNRPFARNGLAVGMVLMLVSVLAGCNGGEFAHAGPAAVSSASSPSPSFVITTHEPCPETTPESSRGNALQPTDGSGQGLVSVPAESVDHGAIESIKLIQEQANEIQDLKSELDELRTQNNELTKAMGKLLAELGELKAKERERESQVAAVESTLAKRSICILTSPSCTPCVEWKKAAALSPQMQTVEKRFIDVTQGKPADIDASEWATVVSIWQAKGSLVPFSWWRDKSGQIRTLTGRYSDSQIEWSMQAADGEVQVPQMNSPPPANQSPPAIRHQKQQRAWSSPIAQLSPR